MSERKRVLVVDDEAAVLRFVEVSLKAAGFEVWTASNGPEALNMIAKEDPDLVVLDILMTPMTGFDVLAELRKSSRVPVIVFTAKSFVGEQALQAGADGYIGKPFKPDDLTAKIRMILER